jgi:hypothetical protein
MAEIAPIRALDEAAALTGSAVSPVAAPDRRRNGLGKPIPLQWLAVCDVFERPCDLSVDPNATLFGCRVRSRRAKPPAGQHAPSVLTLGNAARLISLFRNRLPQETPFTHGNLSADRRRNGLGKPIPLQWLAVCDGVFERPCDLSVDPNATLFGCRVRSRRAKPPAGQHEP